MRHFPCHKYRAIPPRIRMPCLVCRQAHSFSSCAAFRYHCSLRRLLPRLLRCTDLVFDPPGGISPHRQVPTQAQTAAWCACESIGANNMKLPFILALATAAIAGCAAPSPFTPPPTQDTRAVGQSKLEPKAAAECIGKQWMQSSGQQVWMQYMLANDQAFDVYVPGQQPPAGAAAVVRKSPAGAGSWLGFRGADSGAAGAISQCQ